LFEYKLCEFEESQRSTLCERYYSTKKKKKKNQQSK